MAGTNPAMTQLQSPRVASPALATSKRRRQARLSFSMLVVSNVTLSYASGVIQHLGDAWPLLCHTGAERPLLA